MVQTVLSSNILCQTVPYGRSCISESSCSQSSSFCSGHLQQVLRADLSALVGLWIFEVFQINWSLIM